MKNSVILYRFFSVVLTSVYLATNAAFAYKPETNLWEERLSKISQPLQTFSLLEKLPTVSSSFSPLFKKNIPENLISTLTPLFQSMPSSLGTIQKISVPKYSDPTKVVIHIQDVHMNIEAQQNISKAVQSLVDHNLVNVLALEGAFDSIDLNSFRTFPAESTEKVANFLLRENKISGPIYVGFTSTKPIPHIIGIDDQTHYNANVDAYRQSRITIEENKDWLKNKKENMSVKKRRIFGPDLLSLDMRVQDYRENRLSMGKYIQFLSTKTSDISFTIQTFLEAYKLEGKINFQTVETERVHLLSKLLAKLKPSQSQSLIAISVAYRLGNISHVDFYSRLKNLCQENGINLSQFPQMNSYLQYVFLTDQIQSEKLFEDIKAMETAVYKTYLKTEEEKKLVAESNHLNFVEKLLDFSLTKEEWEEYSNEPSQSGRVSGGERLGLAPFENFYHEAKIRDQKMASNLIHQIEFLKSKNQIINKFSKNNKSIGARNLHFDNNQNVILVTGGFHSQGINQELTKNGYAVITFVPKISKVDTENGSAYLSVFTQEKTPLDRLFEGEKLFLSPLQFDAPKQFYVGLLLLMGRIWLSAGNKLPLGELKKNIEALTGQTNIFSLSYEIRNRNTVLLKVNGVEIETTYDLQGNIEKVTEKNSVLSLFTELRHIIPIALGLIRPVHFLKSHPNYDNPVISYIRLISLRVLTATFWFGIFWPLITNTFVFLLSGNGVERWYVAILSMAWGPGLSLLVHWIQRKLFPGAALSATGEQDNRKEKLFVLLDSLVSELVSENYLQASSIREMVAIYKASADDNLSKVSLSAQDGAIAMITEENGKILLKLYTDRILSLIEQMSSTPLLVGDIRTALKALLVKENVHYRNFPKNKLYAIESVIRSQRSPDTLDLAIKSFVAMMVHLEEEGYLEKNSYLRSRGWTEQKFDDLLRVASDPFRRFLQTIIIEPQFLSGPEPTLSQLKEVRLQKYYAPMIYFKQVPQDLFWTLFKYIGDLSVNSKKVVLYGQQIILNDPKTFSFLSDPAYYKAETLFQTTGSIAPAPIPTVPKENRKNAAEAKLIYAELGKIKSKLSLNSFMSIYMHNLFPVSGHVTSEQLETILTESSVRPKDKKDFSEAIVRAVKAVRPGSSTPQKDNPAQATSTKLLWENAGKKIFGNSVRAQTLFTVAWEALRLVGLWSVLLIDDVRYSPLLLGAVAVFQIVNYVLFIFEHKINSRQQFLVLNFIMIGYFVLSFLVGNDSAWFLMGFLPILWLHYHHDRKGILINTIMGKVIAKNIGEKFSPQEAFNNATPEELEVFVNELEDVLQNEENKRHSNDAMEYAEIVGAQQTSREIKREELPLEKLTLLAKPENIEDVRKYLNKNSSVFLKLIVEKDQMPLFEEFAKEFSYRRIALEGQQNLFAEAFGPTLSKLKLNGEKVVLSKQLIQQLASSSVSLPTLFYYQHNYISLEELISGIAGLPMRNLGLVIGIAHVVSVGA